MRRFGRGRFVLALVTGLVAGVASAQTSAPAPAAKSNKPMRTRQAKPARVNINAVCETDAAIYCGDDVRRGVSKRACLRANKSLLSPDCAAAIGGR
jgi:hypothetical protein